ncbi:virulence protein [uncultured Catenibacterium sp.]|uniref:virulence protein n=1 Tax=uncultured Catenibacterium sp. TaxID=286142 RepID=UPI00259477FB|nr:virulence protein [uncultured Catenibacterium sp.]
MRVEFNRTGAERKALVTAISEILGTKAKYMGMPTAAYDFGGLIVDKTGALEFEESIFPKDIETLLQKLADRGFTAENSDDLEQTEEVSEEPEKTPLSESVGFTIAVPLEKVKVGNLTNLLEAKGELIKKALGADDIRIEVDEEKVAFPWFSELPDADVCTAYQNFIAALCKMSKEQKRINSTEKEVTNEKYAFRCFLLRLGFIGAEYKADRKILLKNLEGSAAFKNGAKGGKE